MNYPTILSLPDGSDLILEQTPTTIEIRLSLPRPVVAKETPAASLKRITRGERQAAKPQPAPPRRSYYEFPTDQ